MTLEEKKSIIYYQARIEQLEIILGKCDNEDMTPEELEVWLYCHNKHYHSQE